MDYDPKDIDVINLLKKLKEGGGAYPQEMLALRRQGYLHQVAEVIGGAGLALGLKETLKSGKGAGASPAAGTLVEALLVIAIVAEAGAVAYFYRDQVADFFQSFSNKPRVEEVTIPPIQSSPVVDIESTPTLVETPTLILTDTPISTPSVELAVQPTDETRENSSTSGDSDGAAGSGGGGSQSVSTPNPNANNNDNGNNGNHYGQTPKPERTKQPGNDNSNQKRE